MNGTIFNLFEDLVGADLGEDNLDGVSDRYRSPIEHPLVSAQGSNGTYLIAFGDEPDGAAPTAGEVARHG